MKGFRPYSAALMFSMGLRCKISLGRLVFCEAPVKQKRQSGLTPMKQMKGFTPME